MTVLAAISTLFYIITFLAILVLVGFLITLLVGKLSKNNKTKKVGKIGSLITILVTVVALIIAGITDASYRQIATKHNQRFDYYAQKYEALYIKTAKKAEDIGNSETEKWSDAIDNSDSADDFDVDETITNAMVDNAGDIADVDANMKKIKEYTEGMKANETQDRSFDKYNKSYKELKNLTNLVTSPSGSYNSFSDDFSKYDTSAANAYKELNQ